MRRLDPSGLKDFLHLLVEGQQFGRSEWIGSPFQGYRVGDEGDSMLYRAFRRLPVWRIE